VSKRRSALDAAQLGFTFEPPLPARSPADLAGLDRVVAASVATALKEDDRPREVIAGAMSALLADEVTKAMLDAYASEAREGHNISGSRLFALIAVTERFDLLDAMTRRIGAALLVGEEIATAELGHIDSQIARLKERRKRVVTRVSPIDREGPRK
jgi:hypothetical protein